LYPRVSHMQVVASGRDVMLGTVSRSQMLRPEYYTYGFGGLENQHSCHPSRMGNDGPTHKHNISTAA
jgi:hypothetical protein